MSKKLFILILSVFLAVPLFAQTDKKENKDSAPAAAEDKKDAAVKDDKKAKDSKKESVFSEVILENFEESQYNEKNIEYNNVNIDLKANIAIKDQFPAPTNNSKKYLGIKIYGKSGDILKIKPPKPLVIDKFCKEISFWVYGKKISGEISINLVDSIGTNHRVIITVVDFNGWKKITVPVLSTVKQQDEYLNQKTNIQIKEIQYRPGNQSRLPIWHYIYIDDISATVRDKYADRQSDDW